jgi:hypothetical protein
VEIKKAKLREGMQVYDEHKQLLGDIEHLTNNDFYVDGQRYSLDAVGRIERDACHLEQPTGIKVAGTAKTGQDKA